jgi:glycosyltransferase involved in cell wall biosynthesis
MTSDAMEAKAITISVVIPAYNAADHIRGAIDSVLAQTRQVDEIIVVDDGSTDATPDIAQSYGDKVIYIHQQNASAGATRNAGIRAAKSEWIAFLDSDDEWVPEKIQLQAGLIERNPDISWAYSNCYLHYESRNQRSLMFNKSKAESLLGGKECFENYLISVTESFPAWTGTVIAKKEALVNAGLFDGDLLLAQDIDLWFRLAYRYPKVGYIAEATAIYNFETPESNTKRFKDVTRIFTIIDRHLELSEEYNCRKDFEKCVYPLVHHWMLTLRREERYDEMKSLLNRYFRYLPKFYYAKRIMRAVLPGVTGCYNRLVAKLRKRS